MKKFVIFFTFAFIFLVHLQAQVTLLSGDISILKKAGEYAYVETDWSKAKVVEFGRKNKIDKDFGSVDAYNKSQGQDWVYDWPKVKHNIALACAWEKYPARPCFNKKNKNGLQITVTPDEWKNYKSSSADLQKKMSSHTIYVDPKSAKYKFVVRVELIDMGNGVASQFGMNVKNGGAILKGTVELIEIKTGKKLATFGVDYAKGWGNISQETRLMDLFCGSIFGEIGELVK